MELVILVSERLAERNMTQKQLAELTGLRPAAISEICNNQRTTINRAHLTKIADALGIEDIRELIELRRQRYDGHAHNRCLASRITPSSST